MEFKIEFPSDEKGMLGRECLECKKYFKLKPGTGIETDHCHCPYCSYEGNQDTFFTAAQLKYAESVAYKLAFETFVKPMLDEMMESFKRLERNSRNSFISIKVTGSTDDYYFPIEYYSEEELETSVVCDNCSLEFAIFGVFSSCPDCNKSNSFLIFSKSIESIQKKLEVFSKPEIPSDVKELALGSILTTSVAAFDGLGKELRKLKPGKYPTRPKNLFQNLFLLNQKLDSIISAKHSNFASLLKYFQVRHLIEHNMGVVDQSFIEKIDNCDHLLGRKFKFDINELDNFLKWMVELGDIIKARHIE